MTGKEISPPKDIKKYIQGKQKQLLEVHDSQLKLRQMAATVDQPGSNTTMLQAFWPEIFETALNHSNESSVRTDEATISALVRWYGNNSTAWSATPTQRLHDALMSLKYLIATELSSTTVQVQSVNE